MFRTASCHPLFLSSFLAEAILSFLSFFFDVVWSAAKERRGRIPPPGPPLFFPSHFSLSFFLLFFLIGDRTSGSSGRLYPSTRRRSSRAARWNSPFLLFFFFTHLFSFFSFFPPPRHGVRRCYTGEGWAGRSWPLRAPSFFLSFPLRIFFFPSGRGSSTGVPGAVASYFPPPPFVVYLFFFPNFFSPSLF